MSDACKVGYDPNRCMSVKTGYIMNIEAKLNTPIPNKGVMKIEDYDALSADIKNTVVEVTSNLGTKYLVSCPYSCKLTLIFVNFRKIFHFFG